MKRDAAKGTAIPEKQLEFFSAFKRSVQQQLMYEDKLKRLQRAAAAALDIAGNKNHERVLKAIAEERAANTRRQHSEQVRLEQRAKLLELQRSERLETEIQTLKKTYEELATQLQQAFEARLEEERQIFEAELQRQQAEFDREKERMQREYDRQVTELKSEQDREREKWKEQTRQMEARHREEINLQAREHAEEVRDLQGQLADAERLSEEREEARASLEVERDGLRETLKESEESKSALEKKVAESDARLMDTEARLETLEETAEGEKSAWEQELQDVHQRIKDLQQEARRRSSLAKKTVHSEQVEVWRKKYEEAETQLLEALALKDQIELAEAKVVKSRAVRARESHLSRYSVASSDFKEASLSNYAVRHSDAPQRPVMERETAPPLPSSAAPAASAGFAISANITSAAPSATAPPKAAPKKPRPSAARHSVMSLYYPISDPGEEDEEPIGEEGLEPLRSHPVPTPESKANEQIDRAAPSRSPPLAPVPPATTASRHSSIYLPQSSPPTAPAPPPSPPPRPPPAASASSLSIGRQLEREEKEKAQAAAAAQAAAQAAAHAAVQAATQAVTQAVAQDEKSQAATKAAAQAAAEAAAQAAAQAAVQAAAQVAAQAASAQAPTQSAAQPAVLDDSRRPSAGKKSQSRLLQIDGAEDEAEEEVYLCGSAEKEGREPGGRSQEDLLREEKEERLRLELEAQEVREERRRLAEEREALELEKERMLFEMQREKERHAREKEQKEEEEKAAAAAASSRIITLKDPREGESTESQQKASVATFGPGTPGNLPHPSTAGHARVGTASFGDPPLAGLGGLHLSQQTATQPPQERKVDPSRPPPPHPESSGVTDSMADNYAGARPSPLSLPVKAFPSETTQTIQQQPSQTTLMQQKSKVIASPSASVGTAPLTASAATGPMPDLSANMMAEAGRRASSSFSGIQAMSMSMSFEPQSRKPYNWLTWRPKGHAIPRLERVTMTAAEATMLGERGCWVLETLHRFPVDDEVPNCISRMAKRWCVIRSDEDRTFLLLFSERSNRSRKKRTAADRRDLARRKSYNPFNQSQEQIAAELIDETGEKEKSPSGASRSQQHRNTDTAVQMPSFLQNSAQPKRQSVAAVGASHRGSEAGTEAQQRQSAAVDLCAPSVTGDPTESQLMNLDPEDASDLPPEALEMLTDKPQESFFPEEVPNLPPGCVSAYSVWELRDGFFEGKQLEVHLINRKGQYMSLSRVGRWMEPGFYLAALMLLRDFSLVADPVEKADRRAVASLVSIKQVNPENRDAFLVVRTETDKTKGVVSENISLWEVRDAYFEGKKLAVALLKQSGQSVRGCDDMSGSVNFDFAKWWPQGSGLPRRDHVAMAEREARDMCRSGCEVVFIYSQGGPPQREPLPMGAEGALSIWEIRDGFWDGRRLRIRVTTDDQRKVQIQNVPPAFFLATILCVTHAGVKRDPYLGQQTVGRRSTKALLAHTSGSVKGVRLSIVAPSSSSLVRDLLGEAAGGGNQPKEEGDINASSDDELVPKPKTKEPGSKTAKGQDKQAKGSPPLAPPPDDSSSPPAATSSPPQQSVDTRSTSRKTATHASARQSVDALATRAPPDHRHHTVRSSGLSVRDLNDIRGQGSAGSRGTVASSIFSTGAAQERAGENWTPMGNSVPPLNEVAITEEKADQIITAHAQSPKLEVASWTRNTKSDNRKPSALPLPEVDGGSSKGWVTMSARDGDEAWIQLFQGEGGSRQSPAPSPCAVWSLDDFASDAYFDGRRLDIFLPPEKTYGQHYALRKVPADLFLSIAIKTRSAYARHTADNTTPREPIAPLDASIPESLPEDAIKQRERANNGQPRRITWADEQGQETPQLPSPQEEPTGSPPVATFSFDLGTSKSDQEQPVSVTPPSAVLPSEADPPKSLVHSFDFYIWKPKGRSLPHLDESTMTFEEAARLTAGGVECNLAAWDTLLGPGKREILQKTAQQRWLWIPPPAEANADRVCVLYPKPFLQPNEQQQMAAAALNLSAWQLREAIFDGRDLAVFFKSATETQMALCNLNASVFLALLVAIRGLGVRKDHTTEQFRKSVFIPAGPEDKGYDNSGRFRQYDFGIWVPEGRGLPALDRVTMLEREAKRALSGMDKLLKGYWYQDTMGSLRLDEEMEPVRVSAQVNWGEHEKFLILSETGKKSFPLTFSAWQLRDGFWDGRKLRIMLVDERATAGNTGGGKDGRHAQQAEQSRPCVMGLTASEFLGLLLGMRALGRRTDPTTVTVRKSLMALPEADKERCLPSSSPQPMATDGPSRPVAHEQSVDPSARAVYDFSLWVPEGSGLPSLDDAAMTEDAAVRVAARGQTCVKSTLSADDLEADSQTIFVRASPFDTDRFLLAFEESDEDMENPVVVFRVWELRDAFWDGQHMEIELVTASDKKADTRTLLKQLEAPFMLALLLCIRNLKAQKDPETMVGRKSLMVPDNQRRRTLLQTASGGDGNLGASLKAASKGGAAEVAGGAAAVSSDFWGGLSSVKRGESMALGGMTASYDFSMWVPQGRALPKLEKISMTPEQAMEIGKTGCESVKEQSDQPGVKMAVKLEMHPDDVGGYLCFEETKEKKQRGSFSVWLLRDAFWDGKKMSIKVKENMTEKAADVTFHDVTPAFFLALIIGIRSLKQQADPMTGRQRKSVKVDDTTLAGILLASTDRDKDTKQQQPPGSASPGQESLKERESQRERAPTRVVHAPAGTFNFATWKPEGRAIPKLEDVVISLQEAVEIGKKGAFVELGKWVLKEGKRSADKDSGSRKRWLCVDHEKPDSFLTYFKEEPPQAAMQPIGGARGSMEGSVWNGEDEDNLSEEDDADTNQLAQLREGARGIYSAWELRDAFWDGFKLSVHLMTSKERQTSIREMPAKLFLSLILLMRNLNIRKDPLTTVQRKSIAVILPDAVRNAVAASQQEKDDREKDKGGATRKGVTFSEVLKTQEEADGIVIEEIEEGGGGGAEGAAKRGETEFDFGEWQPHGKALPDLKTVWLPVEMARKECLKGAWMKKKKKGFDFKLGTDDYRYAVVNPFNTECFFVYYKKAPAQSKDGKGSVASVVAADDDEDANDLASSRSNAEGLPTGALGAFSIWEMREAHYDGSKMKIRLLTGKGKEQNLHSLPARFFMSILMSM
eukprot:Cvel_20624.t1-p1 / transcript=Cvel_20624.t1 / gene=Cvel_20624 / organism=Chromera_velia_CCMP2878 / gene_product=Trichohyalin, putative / transcript_product=Trichohyalin, putative / location=Cvel_scaffold1868:7668-35146(+) / protein_length=3126 / sequence_SO=supercontig / SO=protein_coding / is_pseudo=false